ncbi:YopX family protein [Campylobacter sp. CNRCH_2014_2849]|uniref:YopX family protein n=1 Tax=Campylobacter sp. CNRCH_2014_2849 TaxID=2911604 RepID=UPI0021E62A8B|nr:YopX family protein [Campylobacter sp. CNRCH_2014_2849]MCV3473798.1 YopX family protein [Campylobacter sp. CNRCH_2014_2849]
MKLKDFDFRAWDYKRKTFINYQCQMSFIFNNERNKENYLKVMDCFDNKNPKNNEFYGLKSYNSNDIEIELWTGLRDRNGKKIFEGDILEFFATGEIIAGRVVYDKEEARFELITSNKDVLDFTFYSDVEIIGNIHENHI